MSNNPSPEELRRLQELAEMFDDGPAMPGTPSPEHSAHSPGASEVMNAAKHWGRVFGNKAKELSEKAVEKSKEAQDAIARRAAEAKGKKEAERAQNAAAAIPAAAPTELLQVEPEAISLPVVTETMVESGDEAARLERLAPMKANAKKATKAVRENPAVAALIYDGMGALPQLCDLPDEVVDPVPPYQQSPSVPESNPQGAPGASAVPDHAPNNGLSRTKAWQTLAGAALVVLVLAGATAWWVTRHDSETPTVPAATSTAAAMPPVVVTPSQAPVIDPLPVTNVQAGRVERGSTDAVNGGQLWDAQQAWDDRWTDTDRRLRHQDRRINGLGAQLGALSQMATAAAQNGGTAVGQVNVSAGVGFSGGEAAVSIGWGARISDRTSVSAGLSFGSGNKPVAGFGLSINLGR